MAPPRGSSAALARNEEDKQRNVLFDGAAAAASSGGGGRDDHSGAGANEPTVQQLVKEAVTTHKDTTATVNRALKLVEQTKQIQDDTLVALHDQGRQMENIERNFTVLNVELSYSEKLLLYMRRCCCCALFDCCTGADPETRLKSNWQKRAAGGATDAYAAAGLAKDPFAHLNAAAAAAKGRAPTNSSAGVPNGGTDEGGDGETSAPSGPRHRDPNIRLAEGMETTEMALHEETRIQNQALDQIMEGLDHIKNGAALMTEELTMQNARIEHADMRADATAGRMLEINQKSQLGRYRAKGTENAKKSSTQSLKTAMLTHALNM